MGTNMNDSNDKSAMLREMAIFDYVAGNQSETAKQNFEKMMQQDQSLREAVDAEKKLRANMQEAGELEPVSMSNFDDLLSTIEAQEEPQRDDTRGTRPVGELNKPVLTEVVSAANKTSFSRYYATAASVAVFAMLFAGFYLTSSEPKFETLSDTTASEKINFATLSEQSRLAKMTLTEGLSREEISDVLRLYNLSSFEAGATTNQRYVVSESAISNSELARWLDDSRVQQVELFVTNDEG